MVALGFGFRAVRHRAFVVLCLFPSFAFLFSLVYAATAPTRDGGNGSIPFLKKQVRLNAALFSQKGLTFRRTSAILTIGAYCAGFPAILHSPQSE